MHKVINSINPDWLAHLQTEFEQYYMQNLFAFIADEKAQGKTIYPESEHVFAALNNCPLEKVKVVILGQDPYHGEGQAHGLSFSVPKGIKTPPSLVNMYKELHDDVGMNIPTHGNLQTWAYQGVLLLNSVLTVEQAKAAAHQKQGWEKFTDKIISIINTECENVVFLLWGGYAQKKGKSINEEKHLVLTAPHPSPLSVYRGFYGCKHFSKANEYLTQTNQSNIDWSIPE